MDNKITPANALVLYTWEFLQNNTGMQLINGLIPIASLKDEPLFSDADAPYLIFGYSEQYSNGAREIRRGMLTYRISARTVAEMNGIITAISRNFERGDVSAKNVNEWTSAHQEDLGLGNLRFTTLDTTYIEGGQGTESEGGPIHGLVNIAYNYIRNDYSNMSDDRLKQYNPRTGQWEAWDERYQLFIPGGGPVEF